MDMFGRIPDPISRQSLERLATDIGADDEDRVIIDMLHETYDGKAVASRPSSNRPSRQA